MVSRYKLVEVYRNRHTPSAITLRTKRDGFLYWTYACGCMWQNSGVVEADKVEHGDRSRHQCERCGIGNMFECYCKDCIDLSKTVPEDPADVYIFDGSAFTDKEKEAILNAKDGELVPVGKLPGGK